MKFVWLFVFKHLRSYHDSACLKQWYFDQFAATQECHAADTGMTSHPVTVYRQGADLSLCYPLMWNVTLEYTATHFNVLGQTRLGNPSPTFHTLQTLNFLMLVWWSSVRSSVESVPYPPGLEPGTCGVRIHCAIRLPTAASVFMMKEKEILK